MKSETRSSRNSSKRNPKTNFHRVAKHAKSKSHQIQVDPNIHSVMGHLNSVSTKTKMKMQLVEGLVVGVSVLHGIAQCVNVAHGEDLGGHWDGTLLLASAAWLSRHALSQTLHADHLRVIRWVWTERKKEFLAGALVLFLEIFSALRLMRSYRWQESLFWFAPVLVTLLYERNPEFSKETASFLGNQHELTNIILRVLMRAVEVSYFTGICPIIFARRKDVYLDPWQCWLVVVWSWWSIVLILGWCACLNARPYAPPFPHHPTPGSAAGSPTNKSKQASILSEEMESLKSFLKMVSSRSEKLLTGQNNAYCSQVLLLLAFIQVVKVLVEILLVIFCSLWLPYGCFLISSIFTIGLFFSERVNEQPLRGE